MNRFWRAALFAAIAILVESGIAVGTSASRAQEAPLAATPANFTFSGAMTQGGLAIGQAPAGAIAIMFDGRPVPMDGSGRFLIGFDRDAGPDAVVEAQLSDGRTVREALRVAPRAWRIQSLPTLPRGTDPTPEFVRRRAAEVAMLNAARRINAPSDGWRQRFIWPATGRISGLFGSQRIYAGQPGAYHSGTDIARGAGTPVAAPADGVVILASPPVFSLEGNIVLIDHGMGLNSALIHLSRVDVKTGDHVVQGQTIGAVGMTGRATGPHLHWGLKWNEARVDPMLLAGAMGGAANAPAGGAR